MRLEASNLVYSKQYRNCGIKHTTIRAKQKTFNTHGWKSTIYAISSEVAHILFFSLATSSCWKKRGEFGRKMIESKGGSENHPFGHVRAAYKMHTLLKQRVERN